jgi:tRNA A37 threonylcarbamoyltransferase TsaD
MGFPAGPKIDELYFQSRNLVELPYSVKGMDLVFSGLLTAAEQKIGKVSQTDLCYSLMHTAFAMLTEVTERALAHTEKKEVLLVGGVAASKALQEMLEKMGKERGAKLFVPPREACVDSGLLPAWQGLIEYQAGRRMKINESVVNQRWRTDQVEVNWI